MPKPKKLKTPPKPPKQRSLRVIIYTDVMAYGDMTQEKEYEEIKQVTQDCLEEYDITFETDIPPHELSNKSFDVYIFDYGGMLPGCDGTIELLVHELIRQIDDHPNSLFVIYSAFSERWYQDMMSEESRELAEHHNVAFIRDIYERIEETFPVKNS